jgi:hypothetical protein
VSGSLGEFLRGIMAGQDDARHEEAGGFLVPNEPYWSFDIVLRRRGRIKRAWVWRKGFQEQLMDAVSESAVIRPRATIVRREVEE